MLYQNKTILTRTDNKGNYTLSASTNIYIEFKHPGFVTFGSNSEVLPAVLYLAVLSQGLDQVVVSAGKREQKLAEVTVSIDVLKPQQLIENNNSIKLDAVMDNIPGVNIVNGQANIRGGSGFSYGAGSRVLLLVDGLPMISADANDIKWDAVPLENIERVEVIKGAASALYGSGALNGVINIKTADASATPITKFQIFNGIYDNPKNIAQKPWTGNHWNSGLSFFHSQKYKQIEFTLGAYYLNDQGYRLTENFINKRVNGSLKFRPQKLKGLQMGVSTTIFQSDFGNFLYWKNADSALWPAEGSNSQYKNNRYTVDPYITYISKKGWKQSLLGRIYVTDNNNLTNKGQNALGTLFYFEYQWQKTLKIRNARTVFTAGLVSNQQRVKSVGIYGEHRGQNKGLYIQADTRWRNTNLSMGVRREWNQADHLPQEGLPVYRVGVSQKLFKATYIRASYGTGYRYPAIAERFTNTSAGAVNVFPNPSIKAETGKSWEIGLKQAVKIKSWIGYFDLAAYSTTYSQMIDFTFGYYPPRISPFNPQYLGFKPVNVVNAKISGFEVSTAGSGAIKKVNLDVLCGYTYMDPKYIGLNKDSTDKIVNGDVLKYRFKHTWKMNLDAKYKKFSVGLSFRFNSHMLKIDTVFYLFIPGIKEYREKNNQGYSIVDLRFAYQYRERSKISFVVKNLFNKEYIYMAGNMGSPRAFTLQYNLILK